MSDHDEEAHAAAYFSAPHASPQQPAKDRKRRRLHKAEREKDSPPWRTNLYIHPSQMELVGIEFEANEGQNSYIDPASTYYQDGQNFRNGWKAIRAGDTRVLHYHCKKTCPAPMRDFKARWYNSSPETFLPTVLGYFPIVA